jgi:hypothetical protein
LPPPLSWGMADSGEEMREEKERGEKKRKREACESY